jgi:hypothetical protein
VSSVVASAGELAGMMEHGRFLLTKRRTFPQASSLVDARRDLMI